MFQTTNQSSSDLQPMTILYNWKWASENQRPSLMVSTQFPGLRAHIPYLSPLEETCWGAMFATWCHAGFAPTYQPFQPLVPRDTPVSPMSSAPKNPDITRFGKAMYQHPLWFHQTWLAGKSLNGGVHTRITDFYGPFSSRPWLMEPKGISTMPQKMLDWLVVYLPLWKITIRQLGWWYIPNWMEKWNSCSSHHQPGIT